MEMGMPYYRKYGTAPLSFTSGTTAIPVCSALSETNDWWKNHWMVDTSTGANYGQVREITGFNAGTKGLTLGSALLDDPSGQEFEITTVFSPHEIHQAINFAIESAFPAFFDTVIDQTLVVVQDKMEYDLTGLDSKIWFPISFWVEQTTNKLMGSPTTNVNGTQLIDTAADFSAIDGDYLISICHGKSAGLLRSVADREVGDPVFLLRTTDDWGSDGLDPTSVYVIWRPTNSGIDWYDIPALRFDQNEYPAIVYFPVDLDSFAGLRIRIQYVTMPAALTTDASTTIVPPEYILHKACAMLCGSRANDNRSDRRMYTDMETRHLQLADLYMQQHKWRVPASHIWLDRDPARPSSTSGYNPF